MLHSGSLLHPTFAFAQLQSPLSLSRCHTVQASTASLKVFCPLRRISQFGRYDNTRGISLCFSSFTAREDSGVIFGHSGTSNLPETISGSIEVHASTARARERSRSIRQKLFLIDARWLIIQANSAVSRESAAREPRVFRKFASGLIQVMKEYTEKNPVVVVLPNPKELAHLIAREPYRKYREIEETQTLDPSYLISWLTRLCRALGVMAYIDDDHECRDIMGSMVQELKIIEKAAVIISEDSDFLQLLEGDNVTIMKPGADSKCEHISEQLFRKTMHGLHPRKYVDLLALIGKNGTFAGIPGIKPHFVPLLLSQFNSTDELIAAAKKSVKRTPHRRAKANRLDSKLPEFLSSQTLTTLLRHEKDVLEAKRMLSIIQHLRIGISLGDVRRAPACRSHVMHVFNSFEELYRSKISRRSLKNKYDETRRTQEEVQSRHLDPKDVDGIHLRRTSTVNNVDPAGSCELESTRSTNIETHSSDEDVEEFLLTTRSTLGVVPVFERKEGRRKLTGIAIGSLSGRVMFIDVLSYEFIPKPLVDVLQRKSVAKHGVFLRELYKHLLTEHNITLNGNLFDAHIALDLLKVEEKEIRDLVTVTSGNRSIGLCDLLSRRTSAIPCYSVDQSVSLSCALSQFIPGLRVKLDQAGLLPLAIRVEFPLLRVLGSMEITGIPVDRTELEKLRMRYQERLSVVEQKMRDMLPSRKVKSAYEGTVLGKVLDTSLAHHSFALTRNKVAARPTSFRSELESMASNDELPDGHRTLANLFVQHEHLSKFLERDIAALLRHIRNDGRVRTTFVQGSCTTGRLATRNPNLQNIPVRSQLGRDVRNAFRAERGKCLLRADYNQIELRIVASLCGDPFMLNAFSTGVDIHRCIAGKIFDIPATNVTNTQRNQAKQVIYSIFYGVSARGLCERLAVPLREAENLLSEFKIEFPSVRELAIQLIKEASRTGYAKTLLGRRLPLPALVRGNASERRAAGRKAINMPIQGTQADMIKLSMVRIHERLRANKALSHLVLQVHDELILEVTDGELNAVASLVEEEMVSALPLTGVDVAVKLHCGPSWSRCSQSLSSTD